MKTFKQFLAEGGNAVEGVVKINQENAQATIDDVRKRLLPLLGVKVSDTTLLGSAGKKAPGAQSGDIDMAISISALMKANGIETADDIYDFIAGVCKKLGIKFKDSRGLGVISTEWPIANVDGKQPDSVVQMDIMPVQNIKFAGWSFFSPSYLESQYKGVYRNMMIMSIAKTGLGQNVIKVDPESNLPTEWERVVFNMSKGLTKSRQTNISKTGKITKTNRLLASELIADDPQEVTHYLFGDSFDASDVLSFENVLKAILSKNFKHAKKRAEILQTAGEIMRDNGLPIPKELAPYVKL